MGIKGLFQFLKRHERECHTDCAVHDLSVGVDLFWFIHHSKGDFFVFQDYMTPIIQNATRVHCVVDGAPPKGTKEERKEKRKKRDEAKKALKELEEDAPPLKVHMKEKDATAVEVQLKKHKEKLSNQAWYPTREYVDYAKQWLQGEGCIIHQASIDADSELVRLEAEGWIDAIVSNDSDLLTLGAKRIIRIYSPTEVGLYDISTLATALELSPTQWDGFMKLCREMEKKDVMTAYSFIRVYKELDYALEKYEQMCIQQESTHEVACSV
jgi:hypothetical protein